MLQKITDPLHGSVIVFPAQTIGGTFPLALEIDACQKITAAEILWSDAYQQGGIGIALVSGKFAHTVGDKLSFFAGSRNNGASGTHTEGENTSAADCG